MSRTFVPKTLPNLFFIPYSWQKASPYFLLPNPGRTWLGPKPTNFPVPFSLLRRTTVTAPESALSEAAAAALAAWRGNPTNAPGGSAAAKKKQLSAQGNNLTKYWGAPVSSKKSRARDTVCGRGDDGGRGGVAADRSFEFATPDRPPRGTAVFGGEGGVSGTTQITGGGPDVAPKVRARRTKEQKLTGRSTSRTV